MSIRNIGGEFSKQKLIAKGIRAKRSNMIVNHFPSSANPGQTIIINFPQLNEHDVIAPGTSKLLFDINLTSNDDNRTLVNNISRNLVSRMVLKFNSKVATSIDDYDIFYSYRDQWLSIGEKKHRIQQGIISGNGGQSKNAIKHRIGAKDKSTNTKDQAISTAFNKTFCLPLDHEILLRPYYPSGMTGKLTLEITLNNASKVIKATKPAAATLTGSYNISNIRLEFDVIHSADVAMKLSNELIQDALLFDRITRHSFEILDNTKTSWTFNFNTPAKSLKGILFLFKKDITDFENAVDEFVNPNITNTTVTINGVSNQLFSSGMKVWQQYENAYKFFGSLNKEDYEKVLSATSIKPEDFYTDKFSLWLDLRSTVDNRLHGSGLNLDNGMATISVEVEKGAGTGTLICYTYQIMDAQINIEHGLVRDVIY